MAVKEWIYHCTGVSILAQVKRQDNKNDQHLLSAYYVPGTGLSTSHMLFYFFWSSQQPCETGGLDYSISTLQVMKLRRGEMLCPKLHR